jgi:acetolactate synthase-1/2/3 large subunit
MGAVEPMDGAECLIRTLSENGVEVCFMNPGTSEMRFVHALDRVPAMRGMLCLFEGVCAGAADGYGRIQGTPAATLLHLGPGLANGLSNFHNARKARTPIVSIVGEHTLQHLKYDAPLSADIEAFARTVSDHVRVARDPAGLGKAISKTIAAAVAPPGQVAMLVIPADISWSEVAGPGPAVDPARRPFPPRESIAQAAGLIAAAGTALLMGGTTLNDRGLAAAGRLAAHTGARVFADRNAPRMASGRGRFQPRLVPYFPEAALAALAGVRHMLLVETQAPVSFFGYPETPSQLLPEGCPVSVLAARNEDGTAALEALAEECGAARRHPAPHGSASRAPGEGPLTCEAIGDALAALLPEGAIVSDEMVSSGAAVLDRLHAAAPFDRLPNTGGSIGQGLPVALGAACAAPDRKVVALEADGSAMYTFQALWTMARENLDVVTVIFANRSYRILEIEMRRAGIDAPGPAARTMMEIGGPDLDFVRLSESLGVPAARAATAPEFWSLFRAAMETRGPSLIEAVL